MRGGEASRRISTHTRARRKMVSGASLQQVGEASAARADLFEDLLSLGGRDEARRLEEGEDESLDARE